MIILYLFLSLSLAGPAKTIDTEPDCEDSFLRMKFHKTNDCVDQCTYRLWETIHDDGMCRGFCEKFCKKHANQKVEKTVYDSVAKIAKKYPSLSKSEKKIVEREPKKAWQAYKLSWKADILCKDLYDSSANGDESDACRHYVWSGLLVKELGNDFAKKLLNAHEDEIESEESHKMDRANNEIGIKQAEKMIKKNTFGDEEILRAFQKSLEQKELIILKSRHTK